MGYVVKYDDIRSRRVIEMSLPSLIPGIGATLGPWKTYIHTYVLLKSEAASPNVLGRY